MTDPVQPQDLTNIGPAGSTGATAPLSSASRFIEKNYDPTLDRETIRGTIAQALVWTLVVVIVAVILMGLVTAYGCHAKDTTCSADAIELKTTRAVIELVLTPLIGLVGAVTGFYFGEKSASGKSDS
jgi:multisubunit Na+/H+ antiporter MnhC subunit